jgi:hypothetical protein
MGSARKTSCCWKRSGRRHTISGKAADKIRHNQHQAPIHMRNQVLILELDCHGLAPIFLEALDGELPARKPLRRGPLQINDLACHTKNYSCQNEMT